jgi:energy-converting hydrogenase Eha subunit F
VEEQGAAMNLHTPSKVVFLIAVALAVLALLGFFLTVSILTQYQFWFALAAFLLLALGCIL